MPDRDRLPAGFPDLTPDPAWAMHLVDNPALPGTEVRVLLPNGYGLSLVYGCGYSGLTTVEAAVIAHGGDPYLFEFLAGTVLSDHPDTPTLAYANAVALRRALAVLATYAPLTAAAG
jgi:hypothetical protein